MVTSIGTHSYISLRQPLPMLKSSALSIKSSATVPTNLPWPDTGQAAVGSIEQGVLASSHHEETPAPTASIAKIITALAILQKHPIREGEQGKVIVLGNSDVDLYRYYTEVGGSRIVVENGEELTQYQALQAMLLPSANNMSDSMAVWAFGSMDAYISYANTMLKEWGLSKTTVSDASGFSPNTVSTPSELVIIGQKALQNKIIAGIVSTKQANIPVAGTIRNTNQLLGSNGVIGIKTGHTDEAGGCLLFAMVKTIAPGQNVTVVGAVQGAQNLSRAYTATTALLSKAADNFGPIQVVSTGQEVGTVSSLWGQKTQLVAKSDITVYGWKGLAYQPVATVTPLRSPLLKGEVAGKIDLSVNGKKLTSLLVAKNEVSEPSIMWRLTN